MAKKEKSLFWASFADLMTSLFFVMLVLFIGANIELVDKQRQIERILDKLGTLDSTVISNTAALDSLTNQLIATEAEKKVLEEINYATRNIDSTYFTYVEMYKKHKLKIEVNYRTGDDRIENLPLETREKLKEAGAKLRDFVSETTSKNPDIQYLLIIEGQASKIGFEGLNYPLSYQRAYGLKKFWENNDIKFTAKNCEVLICGSGDGTQSGTGLMREETEILNQRFLIHILPKPGQTYGNKKSI